MGQSPPGDTYNEDGDGLPFYQGKTDFGFRFPGRRIYCSSPTRQASIGATLISVRAPVGSANIAREICSIGRGIAALKSREALANRPFI
jgi:type I restriction enzyme S subunit